MISDVSLPQFHSCGSWHRPTFLEVTWNLTGLWDLGGKMAEWLGEWPFLLNYAHCWPTDLWKSHHLCLICNIAGIKQLTFNKPGGNLPKPLFFNLYFRRIKAGPGAAMEMTKFIPICSITVSLSEWVDLLFWRFWVFTLFLEETYVGHKASRMKVVNILKTSITPLNNFCGKI